MALGEKGVMLVDLPSELLAVVLMMAVWYHDTTAVMFFAVCKQFHTIRTPAMLSSIYCEAVCKSKHQLMRWLREGTEDNPHAFGLPKPQAYIRGEHLFKVINWGIKNKWMVLPGKRLLVMFVKVLSDWESNAQEIQRMAIRTKDIKMKLSLIDLSFKQNVGHVIPELWEHMTELTKNLGSKYAHLKWFVQCSKIGK